MSSEELNNERNNGFVENQAEDDYNEADLNTDNSGNKSRDKKIKVWLEILSWVKSIVIAFAIGIFIVVFVANRCSVKGPSMEPNFYDNDSVFAQKISTYFHDFERGDVVILDGQGMKGYGKKEPLIKRIIGMPGETVKIEDGKVYIKTIDKYGFGEFRLLEEDYLPEDTYTSVSSIGMSQGYDLIELGDDEYYCMGDNRQVSNDSRALGPFSQNRIKSVVFFRIYPFSRIGKI